jgi:hypothetical protein
MKRYKNLATSMLWKKNDIRQGNKLATSMLWKRNGRNRLQAIPPECSLEQELGSTNPTKIPPKKLK